QRGNLASGTEDEKLDCFAGVRIFTLLQIAHVPGYAGHAEQAGVLIKQVLQLVRRHAVMLQEVKEDARIDGSATCSHDKPVQRGKSHGGVKAMAMPHSAQARAIAEMGNHSALIRFSLLRQIRRDILVGKAMEAE